MPRSRRSRPRTSGVFLGADGRARYTSGSPWEPRVGYARAVRAGDRVLVSGTTGLRRDGSIPPDAFRQTERALDIIEEALTALGSSRRAIVRLRIFVTDLADFPAIARALGARFRSVRPACTLVRVAGLLRPSMRVEVEAEAVDLAPAREPGAPSPLARGRAPSRTRRARGPPRLS